PQFVHRGFYETVEHPCIGELQVPSVPFRFGSVPLWCVRRLPHSGSTTKRSSSHSVSHPTRSTGSRSTASSGPCPTACEPRPTRTGALRTAVEPRVEVGRVARRECRGFVERGPERRVGVD